MRSLRVVFCSSLFSASLLVPALASAEDVAADLTSKGDPNVNEQRPALPAVAAASPSGVFGDKGQLTVSSDAGLSVSSTSTSGVSGSTTNVTLRPALDYFVANNVSVGGFLGVEYTKVGGNHTTLFGIGPRVGYNLAFSERFSFWPKLGFSYSSSSSSGSKAASHLALNIFAPVMFHPVQHFFLGFGPALDTDLSGDAKQTVIAGRLTIGGYF